MKQSFHKMMVDADGYCLFVYRATFDVYLSWPGVMLGCDCVPLGVCT